MESIISCSHNNTNEVKRNVKHRCDSLPINYNSNKIDNNSKNKEFASFTFDGLRSASNMSPIEQSNCINRSNNTFKKRQIFVLITLAYGNFWIAACVSLQAPFFPREAESKGATSTQYGFVFGIYELMICITSPLFGKLVTKVSPNILCEIGLLVAGLSTILFGFLDKAPEGTSFVVLAFIIRIAEGIASAAFMIASYTVMAKEFPDRIASTFSLLETSFGLGLILGPTLGGAFYEMGGFVMPFAILGTLLLMGSAITFVLMPDSGDFTERTSGKLFKFLSDSGILLDSLAIVTSLNFIGFNAATLEPHLRQFNLSPLMVGCIFVISGGIYAITTPIWGKLCDLGFDPKILCIFGSVLCLIGITFLGPLSFINIETKLWLIMTSQVFIGLGFASKLVTAFVSALNDSIKRRGFPDDISTYGLVSAMFFSSCSIGAFIGPSLGGYLLETIGYRKSLNSVFIGDIIMVILFSLYLIHRRTKNQNREREPLLGIRPKVHNFSVSINETAK